MTEFRYGDIKVYHSGNLWGGGSSFGQEYNAVVKEKLGKVKHICEFGAGPGYIGFSLLSNNLCDKLTLVDINPEAVDLCNKTIRENKLENKVSVYLSDCFDNVPESEKWDLVVSNPPHFPSTEEGYKKDIKRYDPNWRIHEKFYKDVVKHLKPDGSIILQERKVASTIYTFKQMIEENGLTIFDVFQAKHSFIEFMKPVLKFKNPRRCFKKWRTYKFYFIWSKLKTAVDEDHVLNLPKLDVWR